MLSLLVPVVLLSGGAALVLGAVAALEAGARDAGPPGRGSDVAGGGLAHASVTDAGAPPPADGATRAPVDGSTSPPSYPPAS